MIGKSSDYILSLQSELVTGNALEHTYRPALKQYFESIDILIKAVNEPSRSAHGAPDFIFQDIKNKDLIHGYAETKDLYVDLDKVEKSEQLKRYLGYPNLILTNYLEFRFFKNGEKYQTVKIGEIKHGVIYAEGENFSLLEKEIKAFMESSPETLKSAEKLAKIMGGRAARIRENVKRYLNGNMDENTEELFRIYGIMKELLINDLEIDSFADMYAQTLVYGLFVARYYDSTPGNFSRSKAIELVPASNPFLRQFFDHIAGPQFDKRLSYITDDLCAIFSVSDIPTIMKRKYGLLGSETDKDPVIHFYEDFLREYDPELKKQMGAYYTPIPVVHFIIHAVDEILKKEFSLVDGLADSSHIDNIREVQGSKIKEKIPKVQILDPAVGTATFLNEIIKFIYKQFQNQKGAWPSFVNDELLPRLHGFELMMAPYTIAHLKLALTLKETGINTFSRRLSVYLTNTLEEGVKHTPGLFDFGLVSAITKESEEASRIKHNTPIMVIVGNPPYSGESFNKGEYAMKLVEKYKYEPDSTQKLNERNPKWINDDYVKFIAFAEDLIDKNGEGIVAMITNHGYLDNPTFRGMRWHLANTFSTLYLIDLHGNAKKKEVSPDGSPDKNVFDIQQGVSIIVAVKKKNVKKELASVYRADLFGSRQSKFETLNSGTLQSIKWEKINLKQPGYLFVNKNEKLQSEYEKGVKINDLFPVNGVGITTAHDNLVISEDKEVLLDNAFTFNTFEGTNSELCRKLGIREKPGWEISKARQVLSSETDPERFIVPISYRPFDNRLCFYHPNLVWRKVDKIMGNFLNKENIGLMVCRQQKSQGFAHALVHQNIVESSYVSNRTSEIGSSFPLYLYPNSSQIGINENKVANINPEMAKNLLANVDGSDNIRQEDIFDYVYATLYSPSYREKYKDFLKSDFPRIPQAKDNKSFRELVTLGGQLRRLHLLDENELGKLMTNFTQTGSNEIEKVGYRDSKVFINSTQYFDGIPQGVFDFFVGGYQPAQKWLKDRKGKIIKYEDILHYQKIITSIFKTINVMNKIDNIWIKE